MSFRANKNSSTTIIKQRSTDPDEGCRLISHLISLIVHLFYLLGSRHEPEFHGDPDRSPVNRGRRGRGGGVEEHIWGRDWAGLIVSGKPLVPGHSCCGVGGVPRQQRWRREVSVHRALWPAELRQQNQGSVSRGQQQEVHCKKQRPSKNQRKAVTGYSPEKKKSLNGSLKNHYRRHIN